MIKKSHILGILIVFAADQHKVEKARASKRLASWCFRMMHRWQLPLAISTLRDERCASRRRKEDDAFVEMMWQADLCVPQ